jgi:hypothetical protein
MSQTSLTTDTLFVRQINFKDQGNAPIPAGQVLYSRGDGGTYFASPMSNLSTFPYGFRQFIGGSNLSTFATASQPTLWLDQGAGILFTQTQTGNTPHYYIAATAPEQIAVVGGDTLNFSSLTDELLGGRTLYFQGLGDTAVSISDTTVVFQSATVSSLSTLNELLSTQTSVNQQTSSLISTVDYQLSTINLFITSTGISTVYGELQDVTETANRTSTFVFSSFTNTFQIFPGGPIITKYNKLNVDQISTNYVATSTSVANFAYANVFQTGSTLLYNATAAGLNTSFCSPIVSDGTVSTTTDYFIVGDTITSNTRFAVEKQFLYSVDGDVATCGQQVQIGFLPTLSTQGSSLPLNLGEQFVPILQQIQVLQSLSNCGALSTINYVLRNTAKLDEICASGDLWINATSNVIISSLFVSSINGLTPGSGGGGGSSLFLSTFSTLFASTAYLQTGVASSLQISTVMGQTLPILTMDAANNRLGINLGPSQQPRATLDVNGIVYAGNFVTTSDRRLKRNIRTAEIPHIIPVAYRYENTETGEEDLGCMADEVAAIAPECVYTTPAGYKAVSYPKLVPVCLSLIKRLADRVAALERPSV